MRTIIAVLVLVWSSSGIAAAACTGTAQAAYPSLPPLMAIGGMNGQPYYCMPTAQSTRVGDLSPTEWAREVQICNSNCSYEAMSSDPHAMLVPVACGPGYHDTQYQVQPPPRPKTGPGTISFKTSTCKSLTPSKASTNPALAASPRP